MKCAPSAVLPRCVVFALGLAFGAAALLLAAGPATGAAPRQSTLTLSLTLDLSGRFDQSIYRDFGNGFMRHHYGDAVHLIYVIRTRWQVEGGEGAESESLDLGQPANSCALSGAGGGTYNTYETRKTTDRKTRAPMMSVMTVDSSWSYGTAEPSSPAQPSVTVSPKSGRFRIERLENIFDFADIKPAGSTRSYNKSSDGTFSDSSAQPFGAIMGPAFCNFANMYTMSAPVHQALSGTFAPGKPFSVSGTVTKNVTLEDFLGMAGGAPPAPSPDIQRSDEGGGTLTITYTLSYNSDPDDLEAVFVLPKDFETWLPEALRNENVPANGLTVGVRLQRKGKPDERPDEKARFSFELLDTSREPGICLNFPGPDSVTNPAPFDFQIMEQDNAALEVKEKGQSASTKGEPSIDAEVMVRSFDYGAFAILKATARVGDRTYVAHLAGDEAKQFLRLPKDENGNRAADGWEKSVGCLDKNLSADWDGADDPSGQGTNGDGISLYEKYRGFDFAGVHERLKPYNKKYVFCRDVTGGVQRALVAPSMSPYAFTKVSRTALRFIDDNRWTGEGSSANGKRIVNFNHGWPGGHAVDQHGLRVDLDAAENPVAPPGYSAWRAAKGWDAVEAPTATTGGETFPDFSATSVPWSPGDTYEIRVYPANLRRRTVNRAVYHLGVTEAEAQKYSSEHPDDFAEHYARLLSRVISHEMSHGIGAPDHTPRSDGDKKCVMRYFAWEDCPKNPADPFELKARTWPDSLCPGCWSKVDVSDQR
jgi:hypothetical protein